jgi:hypothetical protein
MEKIIDIRGKRGVDGKNGYTGSHGGGSGGHAGPASGGENGGIAYFRIQRNIEDPTSIIISGTVNQGPYSEVISLNNLLSIKIDARGGDGGSGGHGGNGGDGHRGMNGMSAT